jgi:translation initiation factor 1
MKKTNDLSALKGLINLDELIQEDLPIEDSSQEVIPSQPFKKQNLIVSRSTKHRAGKTVIVISGFEGSLEDLENLSKLIKNKCGVGGSVKDGEILIQGEMKNKIIEILQKEGHKAKAGN